MRQYITPVIEITEFKTEDVITVSVKDVNTPEVDG